MKVIKRNGEKVNFDKVKIKKAILKAMIHGSGIIREDIADKIAQDIEHIAIYLNEIEVNHETSGKPYLQVVSGKAQIMLKSMNVLDIQISISHSDEMATAICILETSNNQKDDKNK